MDFTGQTFVHGCLIKESVLNCSLGISVHRMYLSN